MPCNPLGAINFLSRAWGGRLSDIELVNKSEFLTKVPHHTRNQILADQGFTMKDEFACIAAVQLLTPAFNYGRDQFSTHDVETSGSLSSIRISTKNDFSVSVEHPFSELQSQPASERKFSLEADVQRPPRQPSSDESCFVLFDLSSLCDLLQLLHCPHCNE